jgi:NADPH-dependent curcumin reductase CurA
METKNMQVLLARRPVGAPRLEDFDVVENDIPKAATGQFLVRCQYLSLDPYMRGRMADRASYADPVKLGDVMVGEAVGEVVSSSLDGFSTGDLVVGPFGWQQYSLSDGCNVRRITDTRVPASLYLSVLGMPGVTAYVGLLDIGQPKAGETVVVTAASGAVGSVVGQIAKNLGCRVVGIAGGADKCRYVVDKLGMDACVDYKAGNLRADLKAACPRGIDVCFENVGGEIFDTILFQINPFARIALCGLISLYNATDVYRMASISSLLINRATLRGFIISDHLARWPAALKDLAQWVAAGRIRYRESITEGLQNAPAAFIGLLEGKNFGKQLVKLY